MVYVERITINLKKGTIIKILLSFLIFQSSFFFLRFYH